MQYITNTHSDTHTHTYTNSETHSQSTHLCFLPWATPVNNTENRRGEQGNIGEDGWGNRRYISRNTVHEILKRIMVTQWHLFIESKKEPYGQTECEKKRCREYLNSGEGGIQKEMDTNLLEAM